MADGRFPVHLAVRIDTETDDMLERLVPLIAKAKLAEGSTSVSKADATRLALSIGGQRIEEIAKEHK